MLLLAVDKTKSSFLDHADVETDSLDILDLIVLPALMVVSWTHLHTDVTVLMVKNGMLIDLNALLPVETMKFRFLDHVDVEMDSLNISVQELNVSPAQWDHILTHQPTDVIVCQDLDGTTIELNVPGDSAADFDYLLTLF